MKKKLVIFSIIFMLIIGISSFAYAKEITGAGTVYTDLFKQWESLPETQKKNYMQPSINPISIEQTKDVRLKGSVNIPDYYNLAEEMDVKVKNQGLTNQCWAFATTSMLETNIEKRTGNPSPFFSIRHMDYATTKTFQDGKNPIGFHRELGQGGNYYLAMAYLTNGTGAVLEEEMPFENNEDKINLAEIKKNAVEKVDSYVIFPTIYKYKDGEKTVSYDGTTNFYTEEQVIENRNNLKKHLMEYGAITAFTTGNIEYYNSTNLFNATAYYCDDKSVLPSHGITIVGWDDLYSKDNFNEAHAPTKDGAYICLNSYGAQSFDNGFIYISYEDSLIESANFGIKEASNIDYKTLYQNDFYGAVGSIYLYDNANQPVQNQIYIASTYEATPKEMVNKIGISVQSPMDVEVYINPNGSAVEVGKMKKVYQSVGKLQEGYQTIELQNPVEITGNSFTVAIKCNMNGIAFVKGQMKVGGTFWQDMVSEAGDSFVSLDGVQWQDVKTIYDNFAIGIKAFSTEAKAEEPNGNENNNNNNINNNNGQNVNTNTNTNINVNTNDNTVANTVLPNAGKIGIGVIILVTGIGIISFVSYHKYKNVLK